MRVARDEINANRRWFHENPELSFQEIKTAAKIVEILKSYGISEIWEGIGRTGIVALIRGALDGPCIALRADMDALPITETANIPYKSKNIGVMHACGHDGHMAGLLAAARVLNEQKARMAGVVKLIFQPAEEGYAGAPEMIKDGCLEEGPQGPRVDFIYGLHLWSSKSHVQTSNGLTSIIFTVSDLGKVGCKEGPVMAASDKFSIDVKGKGGHGAMPAGTVDAVVEAAAVVTALQTVVSRNKVTRQHKCPLQSFHF